MFQWLRLSALLISLLALAGCGFFEQLRDRYVCFAQAPLATGIADAAATGPVTTDTGVPAPTGGDFAGVVWIVSYSYRDNLSWLPMRIPASHVPGHLGAALVLTRIPEFPYHNLEGLTGHEWELTTTNEADTDIQTKIAGGTMQSVQTVKVDVAWPNRKPTMIRVRLRNHYGWGAWIILGTDFAGSTGSSVVP